MYNRSSRPSSIHLSDNEIFVNSETEARDSRDNSPSPTVMEKTDLLPRAIRRANSKVLTPEVLDLCAKEIQQENMFRKRYEQAALYVYGTSQRHCGLESTTLASQPGSVFRIPHLSDPCFTGFGYFRWSGIDLKGSNTDQSVKCVTLQWDRKLIQPMIIKTTDIFATTVAYSTRERQHFAEDKRTFSRKV